MTVYVCPRCGEEQTLEQIPGGPGRVVCRKCFSKILIKKRPDVIKRIKAR